MGDGFSGRMKDPKEESIEREGRLRRRQKIFLMWQQIWPIDSRSRANCKDDKLKELHAETQQNRTSEY